MTPRHHRRRRRTEWIESAAREGIGDGEEDYHRDAQQRAAHEVSYPVGSLTDSTKKVWLPGHDESLAPTGGQRRYKIAWRKLARYELGFFFHAGSLMVPLSASTPHGTCESAMNAALSLSTSAANEAENFSLSSERNPSLGGRIGGVQKERGLIVCTIVHIL